MIRSLGNRIFQPWVFSDLRTLERTDVGLRPAAVVLCRAVSRPCEDVVTLDVGSKSVAAEMGDPCVAVLGRPDLTALKPSEEHLPVQLSPAELKDSVAARPNHSKLCRSEFG